VLNSDSSTFALTAHPKATAFTVPRKKSKKEEELLSYEEGKAEFERLRIMLELKEAVRQLKLVQEGKMKARPAQELLDEL